MDYAKRMFYLVYEGHPTTAWAAPTLEQAKKEAAATIARGFHIPVILIVQAVAEVRQGPAIITDL